MAQMGNVSGGKEIVEFPSSGAFHHEKHESSQIRQNG